MLLDASDPRARDAAHDESSAGELVFGVKTNEDPTRGLGANLSDEPARVVGPTKTNAAAFERVFVGHRGLSGALGVGGTGEDRGGVKEDEGEQTPSHGASASEAADSSTEIRHPALGCDHTVRRVSWKEMRLGADGETFHEMPDS